MEANNPVMSEDGLCYCGRPDYPHSVADHWDPLLNTGRSLHDGGRSGQPVRTPRKHQCRVRLENVVRQWGIRRFRFQILEYRITCLTCGWVEKAGSKHLAEVRAANHERMPRATPR